MIRNYVKENLYSDIANQAKKYHKPSSITLFVYKFLNDEILTFTMSVESKKIFNENLRKKYLKDKNEINRENSFVWFRYYQIIKLIYLKSIKIDI